MCQYGDANSSPNWRYWKNFFVNPPGSVEDLKNCILSETRFTDCASFCENDRGEYEVINNVRMADIRLASLVYVSTYCVPFALFRQNKPFPLLYLGHT